MDDTLLRFSRESSGRCSLLLTYCRWLFYDDGLFSILKREFAQHQEWMIRAYALGQGAGTQALIAIPWLITVGEPSGLTRDILMTAAWVINMAVSEWIIVCRKANNPSFHSMATAT
jgi:hypothetical protein